MYEFDDTANKNVRKPTLEEYDKSDLIYDANITNIIVLKNLIIFLLNQSILFWPTFVTF